MESTTIYGCVSSSSYLEKQLQLVAARVLCRLTVRGGGITIFGNVHFREPNITTAGQTRRRRPPTDRRRRRNLHRRRDRSLRTATKTNGLSIFFAFALKTVRRRSRCFFPPVSSRKTILL